MRTKVSSLAARSHPARAMRLHRLFRMGTLMVVPLDHPISDGPIAGGVNCLDTLVARLAGNGVDAVVLHKGAVRQIKPQRFRDLSLIVHLSASTAHAPDPNAKYLVTDVPEALRYGADAVSVHVNLGSPQERQQLADLGAVAADCDRWNLPLMAMMYLRGPAIPDPHRPDLVAHAATIAAELGADIVKTAYVGDVEAMRAVTASCPIPLIAAGGPRLSGDENVRQLVRDVIHSGADGIAMGRNIFQAPDPGALAAMVAAMVHGAESTGEALNGYPEAVLA